MASALVHRIAPLVMALGTIIIAFTVFVAPKPDARAAADWQLKNEITQERLVCERWGTRAGTENYTTCLADLNETRVKHDKRHVKDLSNRRNGLTVSGLPVLF